MEKILNRLFEHEYLNRLEADKVLTKLALGEYNSSQISAFITVFLMRNISLDEFLGFRDALLNLCKDMTALQAYDPLDIVGTGGDNKNTFNISTLSCLVVAGAGYKVAKHGNYGSTSISGASNVMEQHGVKFTNELAVLEKSIEQTNFVFLHAPLFNDALKIVAPIRKDLKVRTFFNMMGPVVNPIRAKKNMLGVFNLKMARLYSYLYQNTKSEYAIVHSLDGYDEISLTSNFKVITHNGENIYSPEELGFPSYTSLDLYGGNTTAEASAIFDSVLNNTATEAQKNVVIANSAFAIRIKKPELSIEESLDQAKESIKSGAAKKVFKKFLELN